MPFPVIDCFYDTHNCIYIVITLLNTKISIGIYHWVQLYTLYPHYYSNKYEGIQMYSLFKYSTSYMPVFFSFFPSQVIMYISIAVYSIAMIACWDTIMSQYARITSHHNCFTIFLIVMTLYLHKYNIVIMFRSKIVMLL